MIWNQPRRNVAFVKINTMRPIGRICSFRPIEGGCLVKTTASLLPGSVNICICTKRSIKEITIQLKRDARDDNPKRCKKVPFTLDEAQNNTTSHKRRKHNPTVHAAFSPRSRGGTRPRHNPHDWRRTRDLPPSALRPSPEKDAQPPCAAPWHRRRTRAQKRAHLP